MLLFQEIQDNQYSEPGRRKTCHFSEHEKIF